MSCNMNLVQCSANVLIVQIKSSGSSWFGSHSGEEGGGLSSPLPRGAAVPLSAGRSEDFRAAFGGFRLCCFIFTSAPPSNLEDSSASRQSKLREPSPRAVMDFNVKKLASDAGVFFTRAVQVSPGRAPPQLRGAMGLTVRNRRMSPGWGGIREVFCAVFFLLLSRARCKPIKARAAFIHY